MASNKRFSNKLNQYFGDNIKLSFVTKISMSIFDERYVIIVVTKEDKVYEFEKDLFKNAVLITSDKKAIVDSFIDKSMVKELCGKQVIDLKSGHEHTMARTSDGKVYCWGRNEYGVLGNGKADCRVYKPELNEYLSDKHIIDICCGANHSLVLTKDGQVYAWGWNWKGQIGNRNNGKDEYQSTPYHVKEFNGEKVKAVACGSEHSIAMTEAGHVFSWGDNECGQLGIGIKDENCDLPRRVELKGILIEKISCGREHSLLLSRDGDIYEFGWNVNRQVGTDYDKWKQNTPKKLVHSNKFIGIASHCWYEISAAHTENGLYYIWGEWGEGVIREPKETPFKSFDDIFAHYFQMNYKPISGKVIPFDDTFIRNGEYERRFNGLGKLGEGSFGEVFRVCVKWDKEKKWCYAIKKIRFTTDKEREFLKELETCAMIEELDDERLVDYHDIWVENLITNRSGLQDCTLYIQMELCEKNLNEIIKEMKKDSNLRAEDCLTPLGCYIASELFIEILKSVQYLHQHNPPLIHRDLKPDNILLKIESNRRAFVKIGDFGLAAFHEFAQQSHSADIGSIKYAAPEVLNGRKYDTKADIYSLGVIAQKLFNIDPGRDYIDNGESLVATKYQALSDLYEKMTLNRPNKRLHCKEILKEKYSWALNPCEFDARKEFESFEKSSKNKNSYVLKIAKHVLQPNLDSDEKLRELESESKSQKIENYVTC